ncbi:hypothetical protein NQ315_016223, partial [Exocentrus adspersus]
MRILLCEHIRIRIKFVRARESDPRIENILNVIDSYDDKEFKEHFRLKRSTCNKSQLTFGIFSDMIKNEHVLPDHKFGREKKSFSDDSVVLGNCETFGQISDWFDVSKGSAHRIIKRVVEFLVIKARNYIVWPTGENLIKTRLQFKKQHNIAGIVGAIDGCHIKIKKPRSKHAHVYYNKALHFFCGEPGSIHDSRLLKKSSLYRKCVNGYLGNDFLLGDSAYPCLNWLIPPFRDNGNLTENQKLFNYRHSLSRVAIENAFGLLKGRFRRLKHFENDDIMFITKCVTAAAVLHNI